MKLDPSDVRHLGVTVLLLALAIGIPAAVATLAILMAHLRQGTWVCALRGSCLMVGVCLLVQAAAIAQLRIMSPDVSLKWFLVPGILAEGMILGLGGFFAFDWILRYVALATSALAPLMLMCIRNVEN